MGNEWHNPHKGTYSTHIRYIMNANEVTAFYEGYQANRNYELHNRYQDDWGSGLKQAWNSGWEKARLDRLEVIDKRKSLKS